MFNLTKKITRERLEVFLAKYATDKKTLDIGSGGSAYSRFFPNRITFDADHTRNPQIVGDAHQMPFNDGEFEVILCTEVLEHLHSPQIAIAEMKRVLKDGGILVLSTRFIFPLHDTPNDYYRYTKYGLKHLFREWDILELKEETDTMGGIAVLLQRIGYQTKLRANKISKFFVFLAARIVSGLSIFVKKEFGDIGQKSAESTIVTSGYYIVCRKT